MNKIIHYVKKYTNRKSLVLDAGSGNFFRTVNHDTICIDIMRPSSNIIPVSHFVQGTIENLPFSDSVFDVVCCFSVLQFLNDEMAMREFYRVLKPGGKLLLTLPTGFSPFRVIRDMEILFGAYIAYHKTEIYSYYSRSRLERLINNRFTLVNLVGYNYNFVPRFVLFIYNATRLNKLFYFLRLNYIMKVGRTSAGEGIAGVHQLKNSENDKTIIQTNKKQISKDRNVKELRYLLTDFSYHYLIVLQKN